MREEGGNRREYDGSKNLDTQTAKVPYHRIMKKSYPTAFKAQVVLEMLKETKTVNQRASEHGVAPTVLREWKQAALSLSFAAQRITKSSFAAL
ncbi:MAG: hypothetical protein EI684_03030 [Candidatus Viridilinea halotolerans]|uniref:Transposase n=1 Tax=Candidatus Viridilinea halotolerans TaxID=2491704 RepID=A0A426U894_9CHLR|nr:MAG: hypothetical protein EI684_03030 [Candidatus Viridilinea halotolerans]